VADTGYIRERLRTLGKFSLGGGIGASAALSLRWAVADADLVRDDGSRALVDGEELKREADLP
jgi:hypothetical protein